jgi:putative endonuclease
MGEPKADRRAAGEWGEDVAAAYLRQAGLKILGSRVRFGAREELDLVASDGDTVVFVEVKARGSEAYGRPASAVDRTKRERMSRAALHYLRAIGFPRVYVRFDVVEVVGKPAGPAPVVRHIRNAFAMDPRFRLPY